MELNKNYPWLHNFKIAGHAIQSWQDKKSTKSLTFWALQNKNIDQKAYFEWAIDHYQIPFLEGIFFEQNLMTKTQWNEIKDLHDWTEEILPVAVWNDTIFIGCVEPPTIEISPLGFETRYVLISYPSLRIMWKFVQSLSQFIEKEVTKSIALEALNQQLKSVSLEKPAKKPLDKPVIAFQQSANSELSVKKPLDKPVSSEPVLSLQESANSELSVKKPLDKPVSSEPVLSLQESANSELSVKKPLNKPAISVTNLEKRVSFPEEDQERVADDNNTFPGRVPAEDNVLVMKDFKKRQRVSQNGSSSSNNTNTGNTKFTFFDTVDKTVTHFSMSYNYEELWRYTKSFYCTSLVLRVKGGEICPVSWTGRIKPLKTGDISVNLNDYSLFKVVQKGYSYNGFVVDNPVNKKFFSQIGWQEYPKHVTAIPIKDRKNKLINVFVGFSLEPISRGKIQQIEENVLKFFQTSHKISKVA